MSRRYSMPVRLSALLAVCLEGAAFASESGGESPSIFSGGIGTAGFTLIIFILLVVVLNKFAWKPLLAGLKNREDMIRNKITNAQQELEQAESVMAEYKAKLDCVQTEVDEMLKQAKDEADETRAILLEQAYAEARETFQAAVVQVEQSKRQAVREIYGQSAEFAAEVAEKILEREVNPEDHRVMIQRSLGELESKSGG